MTYVVPIWKILSSNFSLLTMLQIQRSQKLKAGCTLEGRTQFNPFVFKKRIPKVKELGKSCARTSMLVSKTPSQSSSHCNILSPSCLTCHWENVSPYLSAYFLSLLKFIHRSAHKAPLCEFPLGNPLGNKHLFSAERLEKGTQFLGADVAPHQYTRL